MTAWRTLSILLPWQPQPWVSGESQLRVHREFIQEKVARMPETGKNLDGGEMIVASFLVPGVPVPSALPRQHLDVLQDMLADGPQFSLPTDSPKKQQQGP